MIEIIVIFFGESRREEQLAGLPKAPRKDLNGASEKLKRRLSPVKISDVTIKLF